MAASCVGRSRSDVSPELIFSGIPAPARVFLTQGIERHLAGVEVGVQVLGIRRQI
jgi:hypothetical protein